MPWMTWADANPVLFWLIALTLLTGGAALAAWVVER